jgi:DNA-directed RNA polymerase II subunit RPB1
MIPSYVLHRSTPVSKIERVEFGILSADEIRAMAVVDVDAVQMYFRGVPQTGGINDHRMGCVDRRILCGTCGRDMNMCPGHVGCIRLPLPCFNILFMDHALKCLRCVCFFCSRVALCDDDDVVLSADNKVRFTEVYTLTRNKKRCPHCAAPRPSYAIRASVAIRTEWAPNVEFCSDEERERAFVQFTAIDALSILSGISDADATLLGFGGSHPRDLMVQNILVPPPIARPSITSSEGSRTRGQDDITLRLQEINKRAIDLRSLLDALPPSTDDPLGAIDIMLRDALPAALDLAMTQRPLAAPRLSADIIDRWMRLQCEVFGYMNSNGAQARRAIGTGRGASTGKCLASRIRGKDGRVRGNLSGKRVNFSARSVITPDPTLDLDQVGVPEHIAMILTFPERVTASNISELRERVVNGPAHLFGAQTVITPDGKVISLDQCSDRKTIQVAYGWVVERHMRTGDYVIFNRQPSLHRMSTMGHRVVVVKNQTFRLNVSVTTPYNADFDGDEMNAHLVQSSNATAEVAQLMGVRHQLISPQSNKPCMGIVQDTLLGAYKLTQPGVLIDRERMMRYIAWIKFPVRPYVLPPPAICSPVERWTGHQLLSMILPVTMSYTNGAPPKTGVAPSGVAICDGLLVFGVLSKVTLGATSNGIVDVMYREYGPSVTIQFMSDIQRIIGQWLMSFGFSVGVADCTMTEPGHREVDIGVQSAFTSACAIMTAEVPLALKQEAESTVQRILSRLITPNVAYLAPRNAINEMVQAGSKGNPVNIAQICACVGQQTRDGTRITATGTNTRTLPCFAHDETSVNARGFVHNPFSLGLTPVEFFFHAMGGREGLVDTAVKTATSGYIQRCMVKATEEMTAMYDGTVRDAQSSVVQFVYGGDANDPCRIERSKLPALTMTRAAICNAMCGRAPPCAAESSAVERVWRICAAVRSRAVSPVAPVISTDVLFPFSLERLVSTWVSVSPHHEPNPNGRTAGCGGEDGCVRMECDSDAVVTAEMVLVALVELEQAIRAKSRGNVDCLCASIWFYVNARVVRGLGLNAIGLRQLCDAIELRSLRAVVAGGDAVGVIAAQSLGEPATQMTLNTFHLSGRANVGVSAGIPRLREIIGGCKVIQTPMNTLRLVDSSNAESLVGRLPLLGVKDSVVRVEMRYEPDPFVVDGALCDDELVLAMHAYIVGEQPKGMSSWTARIQLNKAKLRNYMLDPPSFAVHLGHQLAAHEVVLGKMYIVSSEANSVEWWIRVRVMDIRGAMDDPFIDDEHTQTRERGIVHRRVLAMIDSVNIIGHCNIQLAMTSEMDVWNETACAHVKETVIQVRGNVLESIGGLEEIDWSNCTSNDINEVNVVLGIEAATAVLYAELRETISSDTYVDPRHIMLITDTMTHNGFIMPINRHGLEKTTSGPLARCSFEETVEVLKDAAIYGEVDRVTNAITSSVIIGQEASIGTGSFSVYLSDDSLPLNAIKSSHASNMTKTTVRRARCAVPSYPESIEYVDVRDWL